jgi:hypothetical protein
VLNDISRQMREARAVRRGVNRLPGLLLLATALTMLVGSRRVDSFIFSTPPSEREERTTDSPYWIYSDRGGTCRSGQATVVLPPRFTSEGGAEVHCDTLSPPVLVGDRKLLTGSELALGMWPLNDQRDYLRPIEIRILLDAAQLKLGSGRLAFMVYDPSTSDWETLESKYQEATSEVVASIQVLRPVPKDFPGWGERTFFGVFWLPLPSSVPKAISTRETRATTPARTSSLTATGSPTVTASIQPALTTSDSASGPALSSTPRPDHSSTPTPTHVLLPSPSATPQQTVPPASASAAAASTSTPAGPGPIRLPSCAAAMSLIVLSPVLVVVARTRRRS